MNFTEKTQAFLVAAYYKYLKEKFGERGKAAFLHGIKHYAMQRGSRMAQRAIRAGEKLDYGTFCRYGEWVPSQEALETKTASMMDVKSISPDFEYHVTVCPWYFQFQEIDAKEAGAVYCSCLDEAINQGYNGAIDFHTIQTMHQGDCCIFRINQSGVTPETKMDRHMEFVKGFDYHCAHTYYSIGEIVKAIFGEEGARICQNVMTDFENEYGEEMVQRLYSYEKENFNCC